MARHTRIPVLAGLYAGRTASVLHSNTRGATCSFDYGSARQPPRDIPLACSMNQSSQARRPSQSTLPSRARSGSSNGGRSVNNDANRGQPAPVPPPNGSSGQPASTRAARTPYLMDVLVGQMVVVVRGSGERIVGVLSSATPEPNGVSVVLSAAQTIEKNGGDVVLSTISPNVTIPASDLREMDASNVRLGSPEELASCVTRSRPSGFRTDTEISRAGASDGGRTLKRWDDKSTPLLPSGGGLEDTSTAGWDQFAANEERFGIKSNYEETMYTTKLDKSGQDFKQREREAERLAKEILSQGSGNAHIAEERGVTDDSGMNEEDKYGAVVRENGSSAQDSGTDKGTRGQSQKGGAPSKALTADFREFVSAERERLFVRKAELAKKEKQNRLADLKAWANTFQLKTPPPKDGVKAPSDAASKNTSSVSKPSGEQSRERQPEKASTNAQEKKPGGSKLNVHASSFNPGAAVFKPGGSATPNPQPSTPPHPFFGHRELRNRPSVSPLRIRDDFKVWKMKKVPEAATVAPLWPYTGRPFRQHFVVMAGVPVMPVFGEPGPMPPMMGMFPDGAISPRPVPQGATPPLAHMVYQPYPQYPFAQPPFQGAMPVSAPGSPAAFKISPHMVPFTPMARPPSGAPFGPQDYNQKRRRGKGEQRTDTRDTK